MSNNLRQIAKDLRSFVKRCKDVHYSDSLLITFLVTGLLTTFAPSIIRADVAEDQQEVSAQAYDTITDLRQSFLRAKKENQKALRGANAELAQLLKQGDQVVKSPWASFQFGTGYTNNDWGTSYKGRGGKKLEYYSRTNDLTKYVFDASKHQYGATNLHISRNEEPNTLAINPANIHEPYSPYTVDQLSALSELVAPSFAPDLAAPGRVTYTPHFSHSVPAPSRSIATSVGTEAFSLRPASDGYNFNNQSRTYTTNTSNNSLSPTSVAVSAVGTDTNAASSGLTNVTTPVTATLVGSTFHTMTTGGAPYNGEIYNSRRWWNTNPTKTSSNTTITSINGNFYVGDPVLRASTTDATSWFPHATSATAIGNKAGIRYSNVTYSTSDGGNVSGYWGEDDVTQGALNTAHNVTYSLTGSGPAITNGPITDDATRRYFAIQYLRNHPGATWTDALNHANQVYRRQGSIATVTPLTYYYHYDILDNNGATVENNISLGGTETYYEYAHNSNTAVRASSNLALSGNFYIDKPGTPYGGTGTGDRIGVAVDNSAVVTSSATFYLNTGAANNAVAVFGPNNNKGTFIQNGGSFIVNAAVTGGNAIYNEGTVSLNNTTMTIDGGGVNGVYNKTQDAVLNTKNGTYRVNKAGSNIIANKGTASIGGGDFGVTATGANAIYNNRTLSIEGGGYKVDAPGSDLIVNDGANANTHIFKNNSGYTTVNNDKFIVTANAVGSNAIRNVGAAILRVSDRTFDVEGKTSNAINNPATAKTTLTDNTFNINAQQSNAVYNKGTLSLHGTTNTKDTFYIRGSKSAGVYNDTAGIVTGTNFIFDIGATNPHASLESEANGIVNLNVTADPAVSLYNGTFTIALRESNGINNAKTAGGKIYVQKVDFESRGWRTSGIQNKGIVTTVEGTFTVNGSESNGINNIASSTKVDTYGTNFTINGSYSNGIVNATTASTTGGTFTINNSNSNGIISLASSTLVQSKGSIFNVNASYSNGINNLGATDVKIDKHPNTSAKAQFNVLANNSYSNGIFTKSGTLKVEHARFTTAAGTGDGRNNGIFIATGATGSHIVDDAEFDIASTESNGIRINDGAKLDVSNSTFVTRGNYNNGIYADSVATASNGIPINVKKSNFTIESGTGSNAIYIKEGYLTLEGDSNLADDARNYITVKGSYNNGVHLVHSATGGDSKKAVIKNMIFNIETPNTFTDIKKGATNNGIYVGGGRTIDEISNSAFNIKGNLLLSGEYVNNNIGILVGDEYGLAKITKIENTTFDVKQTNANYSNNTEADRTGTGIYMYNGDVKLGEKTRLTGDSDDVFITIRNYDHDNTLTFAAGTKMGDHVLLRAVGDKNIGINIQDGNSEGSHHTTLKIENTGTADGWNIDFVGRNNIGVKNNYFAKDFTLINKAATYPNGGAAGNMNIDGEKGIMFANLGYVHEGKLKLDGVSMAGRNSTIAAFLNNNYNSGNVDKATGNIGVFRNGASGYINLQGVIGGGPSTTENSDHTYDSSNSVGVYAETGQQAGTTSDLFALDVASKSTEALTIKGLNIGLGRQATNSTVLWADKGTHMKITNESYTSDGGAGHVSDGAMSSGTPVTFGYNTNDEDTSLDSVVAYANGYFSQGRHGYVPNASMVEASTIEFAVDGNSKNANVDMVSRRGTALFANNGGRILAKSVRAGGHESILAYANSRGATSPSSIEIDGQIVAADNNLLGKNNTGSGSANHSAKNNVVDTYKNVAAVALDGGSVVIKSATRSNSAKEGSTTAAATSSLIYGMAAYAKGNGSSVRFDQKTAAATSVITGIDGALYATENGQIEFAGDIVNQNNIGNKITVKNTGNATGITTDDRNGRGTALGNDFNDHTNVTPFYVNRGVNEGNAVADKSGIVFNNTGTNIDMYDGILLTGNRHNLYGNNQTYTADGTSYELIRDYYDEIDNTSAYWRAKYRGMKYVKAAIMEDKYRVNLGIINQPKGKLLWNADGNTNDPATPTFNNYLGSIGKQYAGEMKIVNASTGTVTGTAATKAGNRFKSTVLNGELEISGTDVILEDTIRTMRDNTKVNDPFNDISMESTLVTIKNGVTVKGDIADGYRYEDINGVKGQGLNMANSLYRWNNVNDTTGRSTWRKTRNTESGYVNEGTINVWGGTDRNNVNIAGMNVVFGTATNAAGAEIKVDHGYGIYATDTSLISNSGDINVTGKYIGDNNSISQLRKDSFFTAESDPSGSNYGIVGISDARATYDTTDDGQTHLNKIDIKHEIGQIKVEGDLAVGIYGENRNDALASDVQISYDDSARTNGEGIDVSNPNMTGNNARGVGIALVNSTTDYLNGATNAGGELTLNAYGVTLGTKANILTGKNGVGIYAESAEIKLNSPSFTVETKDNGVGLWAMDDTIIERRASHDKTFQYFYNGAKDKNGYAMAFGAKNPNTTRAENYLDITFSNKNDSAGVSLVTLNNKSNTGTSAGITGILVNTNSQNDVVYNKGDIKEDQTKSKTHLRSYGAVVNQGTFENWGDITLAESLMPTQASDVTRADMDKVNVGIRTNNLDRAKTKIVNHGDIKIGDTTSGKANTTSDKNIGSWAIYGTNIETGKKSDGKNSQIVINRNSYGIYSGDGDVNIADTDIKVGNDTVLGHVQYHGKFSDGTPYSIDRQKDSGGNIRYSLDSELLSQLGRQRDSAIGVYIDNNQSLSNGNRNVTVNADMEIDRFSHGIVLAEKTGGATTTVTIGSAGKKPNIKLAYSTDQNAGGHVHSTKPTDTPEKIPHEVYEQGNAVYYYSADNTSRATTYANVTMDGDYNTAYFTKGSVINHGNIDLRSQYDVDKRATVDPTWEPVGYGSVGIISENTDKNFASINYGTITTGLSDTTNMMYSVGMGAGRNFYRTNNKNEVVYDRTEGQGYVINEGTINVQEKAGIGMLATGRGSRAINKGTINLIGDNSIGMYIDREAVGENYGTIKGNAQNLKGVIAINGGFIKNYGTIDILGTGSTGIMTDSSKFVTDANGKPVFDANGNPIYITDETRSEYATAITAGQANGKTAANRGANDGTGTSDFYGTHNTDGVANAVGSETSIEEGTAGNPKTTGVGTTIKMPNVVPLTQVTIDGVLTPITNIDTDARNIGDYANNITLRNSIQTGGTRIIDLSTRDEFGNRAWPRYRTNQTSEVTTIGMYVDTSGVRYTNPYNGIQNLTSLGRVNLYFGTEATMYTNAKAIRFGDIVHDDGTIEQSNILKPFNDALRLLPGGSVVNPLSAGLTWQTAAKINDNNQVTEVVMSKVPYHSFAFDSDKSLVNFTNNLDNLYEIARPGSEEKMIFNRLNSLGNGEGHILAQAFDQMRGHIYGGIQQRTNATSNLLTDELAQLRSENNASKDSNKIKAFGRREEYKTDTAGLPDWHSNAGGFVYLHEDETVKLGDRSGWYAGAVNNYFTFKDLARSYENQAMLKTGIFKQTPLDEDGTFTFTIGGDAFFGKTNTKRRFWVVDKEFRAKSDYYTYGADINAKLEKEFRLTEGFSIVPNVGLDLQYGRFSTVNEDGDMALKIKSDDYYSVKPRAGVDFRYSQPVFKKSNFVASVGLSYETELGRLNDVENEAKIKGAWTDYYTIKGDKEDRKGNFKSDLKLGLDNGRLGFTVNTGYDTKGHNFRAGLGLRALF